MVRTETGASKALHVALVVVTGAVAGYLALIVFIFSSSVQETYPFLDVRNESGRPLLIERDGLIRSQGAGERGVLTWRGNEGWNANSRGCEQEHLLARDVQGTVVARHTGACRSDTWTITGEGLSAAPRYQREPLPPDAVEVRLVLDPQQAREPVIEWWRALPHTLERAAAAGRATGVSVHGPFVEDRDLTMYLRGPDADTVLGFARTQVLRPTPVTVDAYVSAPGQPATRTATPVVLSATTPPTTTRTR